MTRAAMLACFTFLTVTPTPAAADRWPIADILRAEQVADAHWPTSECYARHTIDWITGAELDARFPPYVAPDGRTVALASVGEPCAVWIAWDRISPRLIDVCSTLLHEYGHNAGLRHSDDPHDVMHPVGARSPDCEKAFSRPRRSRHARLRRR